MDTKDASLDAADQGLLVVNSLDEALASLRYSRLRCTVRFVGEGLLPSFKGPLFRGAFGMALKRSSGHGEELCRARDAWEKCTYCYLFETPVPEDSAKGRKFPIAPHPLIFVPLDGGKRSVQAGMEMQFDLILIGDRAINFALTALDALDIACRTGLGTARIPARLEQIEGMSAAFTGWGKRYEEPKRPVIQTMNFAELPKEPSACLLRFTTPARIQEDSGPRSEIPFKVLMANLLKRATQLLYFHADTELQVNPREFLSGSESVRIARNNLRKVAVHRYSSRQGRNLELHGTQGEILYDGIPAKFLPLLSFSANFHAGKSASMGFGRCEVKFQPSKGLPGPVTTSETIKKTKKRRRRKKTAHHDKVAQLPTSTQAQTPPGVAMPKTEQN